MSEVWYTSDLHIGHKLVSGIRGFVGYEHAAYVNPDVGGVPDTDAHDAQLAANWDAVVQPGDTVFVLGDISINGKQHALDWIAERPGIKHLISGNHDPVHPMYRQATKLLPHWLQYFETVQPFIRRKLVGQEFLLSHFPYWSYKDGPDRPTARYEQYRLPDLGLPLLHGHTHGVEQAHENSFHVGVDAWHMQLVPQSTIISWIESIKEQKA